MVSLRRGLAQGSDVHEVADLPLPLSDEEEDDPAGGYSLPPPGSVPPTSPSPLPKKRARTSSAGGGAPPAPAFGAAARRQSWLGPGALLVVGIAVLALAAHAALQLQQRPELQAQLKADILGTIERADVAAREWYAAAVDRAAPLLQSVRGALPEQAPAWLQPWLDGSAVATIAERIVNGIGGAHVNAARHMPHATPVHWDAAAVAELLHEGAAWREVAADVAEVVSAGAGAPRSRATALLAACASARDCSVAISRLSAVHAAAQGGLAPCGEPLVLPASSLGVGRAASAMLQAEVAPYLQSCPFGLVVLRDVGSLPLGAVYALNNALSERGGFHHGGAVDAMRATVVLLLEDAPQEVWEHASGAGGGAHEAADARVAAMIRSALFGRWVAEARELAGSGDEAAAAEASNVMLPALAALQRRIHFAVPLRRAEGAHVGSQAGEEA